MDAFSISLIVLVIVVVLRIWISRITNTPLESTHHNTEELLLYKHAEIRNFEIRGLSHVKVKLKEGEFRGYVKCEQNKHDKYAVGVYLETGQRIGFTPKANKRLSDSISTWHSGETTAWGTLSYDDYTGYWNGKVYIPVGLDEITMMLIDKGFRINEQFKGIVSNEPDAKEMLKALELRRQTQQIVAEVNAPNYNFHQDYKYLIPKISKSLEAQQDWQGLLELSEFSDYIDTIGEKYRNTTYRRIEKAKSMIT